MGAVRFYQASRSPLEQTARSLLERAVGKGWRVAVRGSGARLERLDEYLWVEPEDGFLPHGRAGGPHDTDHPVLLTETADCPNGAVALMSLDGAGVTPEEAQRMQLVWVLFDGADSAALSAAREQWRLCVGAGLAAQYWSEDSGRWELKTERAAVAPKG
jgi:DNA polymerase-3 subunit chi